VDPRFNNGVSIEDLYGCSKISASPWFAINYQRSSINNLILMTMRTRTDVLLLAGFCAFLFFYGIGQFGLIGADEPRYAQVAREMLERHDWVTPTLDGHPWLEKPPLYYWQAMFFYSVLGVSDVAARIPSAVDATVLVIAVYLFFRRFRRGVEIDAALITASCAGLVGYARASSMDSALAATFAIGMLAWWAWRESGKKIYLALFYALTALGMLAKGPVAPFLAAVILVLFAIAVRELRLIVRTLWLPGILLFGVIALPWYAAVQVRNPQFFREFILEHNLARFSTDLYHHREPFWYYAPVMVLALAPWVLFVIAAFAQSARAWWSESRWTERESNCPERDYDVELRLFTCCWLLVPVAFFSMSQSKLPGYILPAIPAGAVLLAEYLRQHLEHEEAIPKALAASHALVAAAPMFPALLISYVLSRHRLPAGRPTLVALGITSALAVALAVTLVSRVGLRMLRFVTLIPVVLVVAVVLKWGSVTIDQTLSARPLAVELASMETHRLPVAVCGTSRELEYGLAFYRNQAIARYELGNFPREEHLLVAAAQWKPNVVEWTAGRRLTLLGHYAPQDLDYYYVSALASKP
jgi:4-amino-4-deoxy-L-arabinose transferase-like glycosyltransferase